MATQQEHETVTKESFETIQQSKSNNRESKVALLECGLGLAKISSSLPLAFTIIACSTSFFKIIHQWQLGQVRRVGHQHGSAHTFSFHIKTISLLISLLIVDVLAMCSIFFFLVEFIWDKAQLQAQYIGIASDVTILAISLWLNMAEYMISCYQHWSDDEDFKSANRYRQLASIFHHGVKALIYTAFFSLQCRFLTTFDYTSMVFIQVMVSSSLFVASVRKYTGQKRSLEALVKQLPTIDCKSADEICLICREHLVDKIPATHPPTVKELHCSHQFHDQCLVAWLQRSMQCPMCRRAFP